LLNGDFAVPVRKVLFALTGRLFLSDSIRNPIYNWTWNHIKSLKPGDPILDIGSRDSHFPSFLAWRGYSVTAIDPWKGFDSIQGSLAKRWGALTETGNLDLISFQHANAFSAVISIFSVQHAGNQDEACNRKSVSMLKSGRFLTTVNEYLKKTSTVKKNRPDGDLKVYGPEEFKNRVELPLTESGLEITEKKNLAADFVRGGVKRPNSSNQGNICLLFGFKK